MAHHAKLRPDIASLWPHIDSSVLEEIPFDDSYSHDHRAFFLKPPRCCERGPDQPAVIIACPPCVPRSYVEHFFRHKRDSAIGSKYVRGGSISNMEGALHTLCCALVPIQMTGDYAFRSGQHDVVTFGAGKQTRLVRRCILSTAIHPDFEFDNVVAAAVCLEDQEVFGQGQVNIGDIQIPSADEKANDETRQRLDDMLKRRLVFHFCSQRTLPAVRHVGFRYLSSSEHCVPRLSRSFDDGLALIATIPTGQIISLEMVGNMYTASLANELTVLEQATSRHDGYVYTYDPPSIFARALGPSGATLLNRLFIRALRLVVTENKLQHMHAFVFNDYADKDALPLVKQALESTNIPAFARNQVFDPDTGFYRGDHMFPGAALVIHNNSDAFGQNIETEACTSLDGAIGCFSDAAAVLRRNRPDLTAHVI